MHDPNAVLQGQIQKLKAEKQALIQENHAQAQEIARLRKEKQWLAERVGVFDKNNRPQAQQIKGGEEARRLDELIQDGGGHYFNDSQFFKQPRFQEPNKHHRLDNQLEKAFEYAFGTRDLSQVQRFLKDHPWYASKIQQKLTTNTWNSTSPNAQKKKPLTFTLSNSTYLNPYRLLKLTKLSKPPSPKQAPTALLTWAA